MQTIAIAIVICLGAGFIAGAIASSRTGKGFGTFFIIGALFPLIGIILAAVQPKRITAPTYAAGWYPDPHGQAGQRWFDGQEWTQHVAA